jgi:hypothetical protein
LSVLIGALDVMMVVGPEYRHGLGLGPQNLETWKVNWYSKGALDVMVMIGSESRSTNQWIRTWICAVFWDLKTWRHGLVNRRALKRLAGCDGDDET